MWRFRLLGLVAWFDDHLPGGIITFLWVIAWFVIGLLAGRNMQ
jgi:hypothetical protein